VLETAIAVDGIAGGWINSMNSYLAGWLVDAVLETAVAVDRVAGGWVNSMNSYLAGWLVDAVLETAVAAVAVGELRVRPSHDTQPAQQLD
jgi:hypothetical protein